MLREGRSPRLATRFDPGGNRPSIIVREERKEEGTNSIYGRKEKRKSLHSRSLRGERGGVGKNPREKEKSLSGALASSRHAQRKGKNESLGRREGKGKKTKRYQAFVKKRPSSACREGERKGREDVGGEERLEEREGGSDTVVRTASFALMRGGRKGGGKREE